MKQLRILNLVILLGFAVILFGLYSLQQLISAEQVDASNSISLQRKTLNEYALRIYEITIDKSLADAKIKIKHSLTNPLLDDSTIILIENGVQKLPRLYASHVTQTNLVALYKSILDSQPTPSSIQDALWLKRLSLYRQAISHIRNKHADKIQLLIRQILKHRSLYQLDPRFDIPSAIALLQVFSKQGKPNQQLMNSVLFSGYRNAGKTVIKGLQPDLLLNRSKFLKSEFKFFAQQIIALSQKHNVNIKAFRNRVKQQALVVTHLPPRGKSHINRNQWYMASDNIGNVTGFKIDIKMIRALIQKHMSKAGLILIGDKVVFSPTKIMGQTGSGVSPHLQRFEVLVETPRWSTQLHQVKQRYIIKTSLILVTGLVSLLLGILSLLHQRRKQEYIDLKSDFIQAISHELRTPLTSIRLMAETLEIRLADSTEAKDYPTRIVRDIDGLSFLVENILSFNRLEKGLWSLERSPINIEDIISSINSEIHLYTNKIISISVIQKDESLLEADLHLLKMLLFNLIRNSCYYNRNDEIKISISCESSHENYIEYKDNGIGIAKDKWKNVFKDFYRIVDSKRGNIRGSGLGLAICRKIMRLHGGNIFIDHSDSQGTRFGLTFGKT